MQLFSNERIITASANGKVVLTSQRLHLSQTELGKSYEITIALEDISSIQRWYRSTLLWLVLAVLSLLVVGYRYYITRELLESPPIEYFVVPLFAATVFFILYIFSKRQVVSIHPNGGKSLEFNVKNISDEQIEDFLYHVQLTKAQRIYSLYNEPFVEEKKESFETVVNVN